MEYQNLDLLGDQQTINALYSDGYYKFQINLSTDTINNICFTDLCIKLKAKCISDINNSIGAYSQNPAAIHE